MSLEALFSGICPGAMRSSLQDLEHRVINCGLAPTPKWKWELDKADLQAASRSFNIEVNTFVKYIHLFTNPFMLARYMKSLVFFFLLHTLLIPGSEVSWEFKGTFDWNQINCCCCLGNLWRLQYLICQISQVSMSQSHLEGKPKKANGIKETIGL